MPTEPHTPSQEELVKRYFDAHARQWETIYGQRDLPSVVIQQRRAYVLGYVDRIPLNQGAKFLDLGCGAGATAVELLKRGFRVVGMDVSENMLERARDRCARLGLDSRSAFRVGDAEALDLADDAFDVVIAMGLIEYLRWNRWALQETRRVLKPGGHLIVTVPNQARLSMSQHWLMRRAAKAEHRVEYYLRRAWTRVRRPDTVAEKLRSSAESNPPPRYERRLYRPAELRHLLEQIDFQIIDSRSHGFGPLPFVRRSARLSIWVDSLLGTCTAWGVLPVLAERGSDYLVLCRKPVATLPLSRTRGPATLDTLIDRYEARRRSRVLRRDEWLKHHAEYADPEVTQWQVRRQAPRRVLVVSPHPDDEIIGCGGTLEQLIEAGSSVTVLHATNGSATMALEHVPQDARHAVRLNEAKAVAQSMGFAEVVLWAEPDEDFRCTPSRVKTLTALLDRVTPDLIFVPFVNDPHPTHRAVNELLASSLERSRLILRDVRIASYEVWSLVPANRICLIDDVWDRKCRMLAKYRTAMKLVDYIRECEIRHAYHASRLLGTRGLVEPFFEIDARAYVALAAPTEPGGVLDGQPAAPEAPARSAC